MHWLKKKQDIFEDQRENFHRETSSYLGQQTLEAFRGMALQECFKTVSKEDA